MSAVITWLAQHVGSDVTELMWDVLNPERESDLGDAAGEVLMAWYDAGGDTPREWRALSTPGGVALMGVGELVLTVGGLTVWGRTRECELRDDVALSWVTDPQTRLKHVAGRGRPWATVEAAAAALNDYARRELVRVESGALRAVASSETRVGIADAVAEVLRAVRALERACVRCGEDAEGSKLCGYCQHAADK